MLFKINFVEPKPLMTCAKSLILKIIWRQFLLSGIENLMSVSSLSLLFFIC